MESVEDILTGGTSVDPDTIALPDKKSVIAPCCGHVTDGRIIAHEEEKPVFILLKHQVIDREIRTGDSKNRSGQARSIDNGTGLFNQIIDRPAIDGICGVDLVVKIPNVSTINTKVHLIIRHEIP
ncbi:MAG: hypothetical protein A4E42_02312 [Methanoregulaceae archaeon PtaU1.Bin222]|nr:MAG: hypothetical protein A4E42_02312 [Methanoregulaceae archaeon PtaU1.Bin222]